ncbi:LppA family lipoprotein [Mycobacterium lacus]|nr:LppA family lipoprotein [Mycobacterium lacus]MCV7123117.1 LppA family lipoprotein [Mycobacterium lacus]
MMFRVVAGILGMVVMCLSVSGCGDPGPGMHGNPGPERVAELESGLRSKPSFEATRADYVAATNQMAEQIAALVPGMSWHVEENSWGGCGGEYVWTRARKVHIRIVLDRAIPDAAWPKALQIVKDGAARFGATSVSSFVDQPGNKDLVVFSPEGAQFHFGTAVQTILAATSDCRMRETDTPTPASPGQVSPGGR